MNVESSDFAFIDNKLGNGSLGHSVSPDFNLSKTDAVGRRGREHSERVCVPRFVLQVRQPQVEGSEHIGRLQDFEGERELIRVAETLCVLLDLPQEVEAVLHIVATNQTRLKGDHCVLLCLIHVDLDYRVVMCLHFHAFLQLV